MSRRQDLHLVGCTERDEDLDGPFGVICDEEKQDERAVSFDRKKMETKTYLRAPGFEFLLGRREL